MGAALFIVLQREIPAFDAFVDGKAVSRAEGELARMARDLGVRPLLDFFSQDPEEVAQFLDEVQGTDEEVAIPDQVWFEAGDGLQTVDALLEHLTKSPESLRDSADVVRDLRQFQSVLRRAAQEGIGWHLAVDF